MSVFTYHLLEALQGAANQPGDKVVRVSHFMNYLSKTVPASARDLCKAEQTPFFDFATEDFAIALLHGGKGLATEGWDKQQAEEKIRGITTRLITVWELSAIAILALILVLREMLPLEICLPVIEQFNGNNF